MRHLLLALGVIAVITGCSQATAQELFGVESLGEKCLVLTCFYECQAAPGPTTFTFWNELTTLQLANISDVATPTLPCCAAGSRFVRLSNS